METPGALISFFVFTKENISLFSGESLLRRSSIQSINKFLGNRNQNSLDTCYFSAIFHPDFDNCAHNYQTRAANKSNLKEFSDRTKSFKYFYFLFVLVNGTPRKTPCTKLNLSSISNQC